MGTAQKLNKSSHDSRNDCSVLDAAFLNRNTFDDLALRNEILNLFRAQLDGTARNLLLPLDAEAWHFLTHTLKGAAAGIGATGMVVLVDQWAVQQPPATDTARKALAADFAKARADFEKAAAKLSA